MKLAVVASVLMAAAWAQNFPPGSWKTDTSKRTIDLRELLSGGPPKDGIPAIDHPKFISAKEASWLSPGELLILARFGEEVRGYPLQILMWHELVNDRIGQVPILVSYCPLCNSAIVFDRRVDGRELDFGVSGMLRNSDMVMYDRQTDSLWQQITGEGIVGTYAGTRLAMLPSQLVSFSQLLESDPDALVLSRETGFRRDYGRNPYRGYEFGPGPIMPVKTPRKAGMKPMDKLLVIRDGETYRAYPVSYIAESGVVGDVAGGKPIVIFYSPEGASPVDSGNMKESRQVGTTGVFLAETASGKLHFRRENGRVTDTETGSTWTITGRASAGRLAGTRLKPVEHGLYFAFAWLAFRPDTVIVGSTRQKD